MCCATKARSTRATNPPLQSDTAYWGMGRRPASTRVTRRRDSCGDSARPSASPAADRARRAPGTALSWWAASTSAFEVTRLRASAKSNATTASMMSGSRAMSRHVRIGVVLGIDAWRTSRGGSSARPPRRAEATTRPPRPAFCGQPDRRYWRLHREAAAYALLRSRSGVRSPPAIALLPRKILFRSARGTTAGRADMEPSLGECWEMPQRSSTGADSSSVQGCRGQPRTRREKWVAGPARTRTEPALA